MPTKKIAGPQEIYQIKVTLLGAKPPIWRRLLVPVDLKLSQLHDVLQAAMGWFDSHLHEFSSGKKRFGVPDDEVGLMGMPDVIDDRTVRLPALLGRVGAKAKYMYDFGDGWEHSIVLEKRLPVDPSLKYPVCIAGKRACPPEDCGGVWGFHDLLEAVSDPNHAEHKELLGWVGEGYDPEYFSLDDVNRELKGR